MRVRPTSKTGRVVSGETPWLDFEIIDGIVKKWEVKVPKIEMPGTELQKLFSWIKQTGSCQCKDLQAEMDRRGCDWCEENIEMLVKKIVKEARRRKLPVLDVIIRTFVRKAIKNARDHTSV